MLWGANAVCSRAWSHYVLYKYKSTNTDAAPPPGAPSGGQRIVLARLAPGASHVIDWVLLGLSRERYSVYLLYQYKSTNTDAICRESLSPIDVCVDVGNAWGQLLLGSTSTGAFGLLQVSNSKEPLYCLIVPSRASIEP